MLGAPWNREMNPEVKNFWLIIITATARSSSNSPRNTRLSNAFGAGQPHIPCPMEKYMRMRRIGTESRRRLLSFGVSWSFRASASAKEGEAPEEACFSPPLRAAPYPAASTARMMSADEAVPSTPMEFVRRLTAHDVTPGTPETAFSTLLEQAAQLIPVTLYCSIFALLILSLFHQPLRCVKSSSAVPYSIFTSFGLHCL